MIVNVSKAKAQLSKLIDRVYQGEKWSLPKTICPLPTWCLIRPRGSEYWDFSRIGRKFPMKPFLGRMRKSKACSTGMTIANPSQYPRVHPEKGPIHEAIELATVSASSVTQGISAQHIYGASTSTISATT